MFSTYLNREIELKEGTATGVGGKKISIVFHAALEHFIVNELAGKVSYDFPVIIPSTNDPIATCSMWDASGRKVTAIGEATKDTLVSNVATAYPTTIAAERAFDRAAIRFLGLGPGVYSNLELPPDGPKNYDNANLTDGSTSQSSEQPQANSSAPVESTKTTAQPAVQPAVQPTAQPTAQPTVPTAKTPAGSTDGGQGDGAVIITLGKYAGKNKTVAEVFCEDLQWLKYITANVSPKKDDLRAQVDAARRYIAAQEGH